MRPVLRAALRYFLTFFLLYSILIGISLIPRVGFMLNNLYQGPTEPILKGLFSRAYLQLRADEADPNIIWMQYASKKEVMEQMAQAQGQRSMMVQGRNSPLHFYNLFLTFYLFFFALMVLSPVRIGPKMGKLVLGTVIFYLYTVFKIWLQLMITFNEPETAIYSTAEFPLKIIRWCLSGMTLGANILFVLILWIVLVFNRNNWQAFLERTGLGSFGKKTPGS